MNTKDNKSKKKTKKFGEYFGYDFGKVTGIVPVWLLMRPKVIRVGKNKAPKGAFMISSNHCTFLDPLFLHCIFWKRRICSLATKDLYKNKLMTFILDSIHCIQVDKSNFNLNSFHEVTKQLKNGKVVMIFPEGQVNRNSKEMTAFKSGVVLMANTAKAPIVPVYLVPPKRWYNQRTAVVGDPIDVRELCGVMPTVDQMNGVGDYVQQKQEELKEFYYNKICPNREIEQNTVKKHQEA